MKLIVDKESPGGAEAKYALVLNSYEMKVICCLLGRVTLSSWHLLSLGSPNKSDDDWFTLEDALKGDKTCANTDIKSAERNKEAIPVIEIVQKHDS